LTDLVGAQFEEFYSVFSLHSGFAIEFPDRRKRQLLGLNLTPVRSRDYGDYREFVLGRADERKGR
jgi:hypothetical protein